MFNNQMRIIRDLSPAMKASLGGGLFVLFLAMVLIVFVAFSGSGDDSKLIATEYANQAQAAFESGNLEGAADIIEQGLAEDAANSALKDLKNKVETAMNTSANSGANTSGNGTLGTGVDNANKGSEAGYKTGVDTGGKDIDPVVAPKSALEKKYIKKVGKPEACLPDTLSGYQFSTIVSADKSSVISASPISSDNVASVQWSVMDAGLTSSAKKYVTNTNSKGYTKNKKDVKVGEFTAKSGTSTVGSGTASFNSAAVTLSIGRYGFQVLVNGGKGSNAQEMQKLAEQYVKRFKF